MPFLLRRAMYKLTYLLTVLVMVMRQKGPKSMGLGYRILPMGFRGKFPHQLKLCRCLRQASHSHKAALVNGRIFEVGSGVRNIAVLSRESKLL